MNHRCKESRSPLDFGSVNHYNNFNRFTNSLNHYMERSCVQKRFTISVTPELAAELTAVKQSSYPGVPRDAMFRDLIIRGLAAWEKQSGKNSQPV